MEVLNVMDANEEKKQSFGRRECGRLMGSLLVLLHGTAPTRWDFEKLAEDNAQLLEKLDRHPDCAAAKICAHENNEATPFYEHWHRENVVRLKGSNRRNGQRPKLLAA